MSAPTITLTGVFGLDALLLYKTEKRFSSMAGNISSAKTFAQDFSSVFCSLAVNLEKFTTKYMNFSRYYSGTFDPGIIICIYKLPFTILNSQSHLLQLQFSCLFYRTGSPLLEMPGSLLQLQNQIKNVPLCRLQNPQC